MRNNKGVSAVVTTVLIILIVLVAIAIVWVVIKGVIDEGAEQVDLGKLTLDVDIERVTLDNSTNNVSIKIKRNPGVGSIKGVKFIFYTNSETEEFQEDITLEELGEAIFMFHLDILDVDLLTKISLVPVLKTSSGTEFLGNLIDIHHVTSSSSSSSSGGPDPCTPGTCASLGYGCGTPDDGCGGTLNCGNCSSGYFCNSTYQCHIVPNCSLISAYWSFGQVEEDTIVNLYVNGTDCDNQDINFTIWEYDSSNDDDAVTNNPSNLEFTGDQVVRSWTAEYQDDSDGNGDPPEYYFIAKLVTDNLNNITSSDPKLNVTEEVIVPDTTPPTFDNLANQTLIEGQSLYYDIDASDSESNIGCFKVNDTINFNINCSGVLTNVTSLNTTLHWLNISVNDTEGNENSGEIYINVTMCIPDTCASLGYECGADHDDGCGGTLDCGNCSLGYFCNSSFICEAIPAQPNITVTVDSIYASNPDYDEDNLIDGNTDPDLRITQWASEDLPQYGNPGPHWVEINFSSQQTIGNITVWFAHRISGVDYATSQQIDFQYWNGTGYELIQTYLSGGAENIQNASIIFTPVVTNSIRLWQPAYMGPPTYNSVMWLSEIEWGEDYAPPPCVFTNATWLQQSIGEGATAILKVEGTNCNGKEVNFTVMEDDFLSGEDLFDDNVSMNPVNANFSGDIASSTWIAEYQGDGILGGNPEYYFIATLVEDPSVSITSVDPELEVYQTQQQTNLTCTDFSTEELGGKPCIEVTACGELNQSSTYYLLMNDIISNNSCILLNNNNITFDLNNHTVYYAANPKHVNTSMYSDQGVTLNRGCFTYVSSLMTEGYICHYGISNNQAYAISNDPSGTPDWYFHSKMGCSDAEIKNGRVIQANEQSIYSHAIYLGTPSDVACPRTKIHDMYIEVPSNDSFNLYLNSDDDKIYNNTLVSKSTHISYRSFAPAVVKSHDNFEFYNNTIIGGPCIGVDARYNSEIYGNNISHNASSQNAYAIRINSNSRLYDNYIEPIDGRGILVDCASNVTVYNNTLIVKQRTISDNKAYGIRLRSRPECGIGSTKDNLFYDNDVTVYAGLNPPFNTHGAAMTIGSAFEEGNTGNMVVNNTFRAITYNSNYVADGILLEGPKNTSEDHYWGRILIKNNVVKGNNRLVSTYNTGGNYLSSNLHELINTHFVKEEVEDSSDFTSMYFQSSDGLEYSAADFILLNSSFEGGASLDDIKFSSTWCGETRECSYYVKWFLEIYAEDDLGSPIDGALIEIRNSTNYLVYSGTTTNGHSELLNLTEFYHNNATGKVYHSPYNISVTYNGNTHSRIVNFNESKTEIFTFTPLPKCNFTNATWLQQSIGEGATAILKVEGTNCNGKEVNFTVMEYDFPGGGLFDDDVALNPINTYFIGNITQSVWQAEWQAESWPEDDPPEYYFIATLVEDPSVSITSVDPKLEVTTDLLLRLLYPADQGIVEEQPMSFVANFSAINNIDRAELWTNVSDWSLKQTKFAELPNMNNYDELNNINMSDNVILMHFNDDYLDYSGNNNDASCTICPTSTKGIFDRAYNFTGTEFFDLGDINSLDGLTNMTISAWVKPSNLSDNYQTIVGKQQVFALRITPTTHRAQGFLITSSHNYYVESTSMLQEDKWQNIVLLVNSSNISIYYNGQLENTMAMSEAMNAGDNSVSIGKSIPPGSTENFYYGGIDEIALWNRSLSGDEIKSLYNVSKYYVFNFSQDVDQGLFRWNVRANDSVGKSIWRGNRSFLRSDPSEFCGSGEYLICDDFNDYYINNSIWDIILNADLKTIVSEKNGVMNITATLGDDHTGGGFFTQSFPKTGQYQIKYKFYPTNIPSEVFGFSGFFIRNANILRETEAYYTPANGTIFVKMGGNSCGICPGASTPGGTGIYFKYSNIENFVCGMNSNISQNCDIDLFTSNQWHNVSILYNGSSRYIETYIEGIGGSVMSNGVINSGDFDLLTNDIVFEMFVSDHEGTGHGKTYYDNFTVKNMSS